MAEEQLFHVGVKALIENPDSKILLLKAPGWEANNIVPHWDIPGGRIQKGGTAQETLSREVEEETGITEVLDSSFFASAISNHTFTTKEGLDMALVLMVYKVKIPKDSKIKLSDEHTEFEWVDKSEAAKRLEHKYPPEFTKLLEK